MPLALSAHQPFLTTFLHHRTCRTANFGKQKRQHNREPKGEYRPVVLGDPEHQLNPMMLFAAHAIIVPMHMANTAEIAMICK